MQNSYFKQRDKKLYIDLNFLHMFKKKIMFFIYNTRKSVFLYKTYYVKNESRIQQSLVYLFCIKMIWSS